MPTLMTTSLPANLAPTSNSNVGGNTSSSNSCNSSPAELILSFGGVDFSLTPSSKDAEVSYRNNGQAITLSLKSFTGSLQVSLQGRRGTVLPMSATVEEEPSSPEAPPKIAQVSPRQQQLSFDTPPVEQKKSKKKTDTERKRSISSKKGSETSHKIRRTDSGKGIKGTPATQEPLTLCQSMPDFSQTIPSSDPSGNESSKSGNESGLFPNQPVSSNSTAINKPKSSVKEILDRINSSDDSMGTARQDDEKSLISNGVDAASSLIVEESSESVSKTSSPNAAPKPTGHPPPCARWGHTMTKVKGDRLLVYGGQSFDDKGKPIILSDVHVYDMKERTWSKPINSRGEARQWHSATFLPERQLLLTFGGETMDTNKKNKVITSDSLRVLDTEIHLWYPPAVSGDVPSARSGHSATLLPNTNDVVLFGGVKGAKWLNTVSVLDTARWIWTTPNVQGSPPKPRSYHSATAVKGPGGVNRLVVFGGNNKTSCFDTVHVLETKDGEWKWFHPAVTGKVPFPRTGHSATLMEDGSTICIYGGWDPNEEDAETGEDNIFKSSFLLDTDSWTWKKGPKAQFAGSGNDTDIVQDSGAKRCGHTSELNSSNGEILLFGGRIPDEELAGDFQRLCPENKMVGLVEKKPE